MVFRISLIQLVATSIVIHAFDLADIGSIFRNDEPPILRNSNLYSIPSRLNLLRARPPLGNLNPIQLDDTQCYGRLPAVFFEALATFLASNAPQDALEQLAAAYDSQFEPDTGAIYFDNKQWTQGTDCTNQSEPSNNETSTETSITEQIKQIWCRVRKVGSIPQVDINSLLDIHRKKLISRNEMAQTLDTQFNPSSRPVDQMPWHILFESLEQFFSELPADESLDAVRDRILDYLPDDMKDPRDYLQKAPLIPALLAVVSISKNLLGFDLRQSPGTKIREIMTRICRLIDVEAQLAGGKVKDCPSPTKLSAYDNLGQWDMPVSCVFIKVLASVTSCVGEIPSVDQPRTCEDFEERWDSQTLIYGLDPNQTCSPQPFLLQTDANPFTWGDPQLKIPMMLKDLRPLPPTISTANRNSELLTHLGAYLALTKQYYMGWNDWFNCPTQFFDKERYLIPGWRVFHAVFLDSDEINKNAQLLTSTIIRPWAFLSENDWNKCEVLISLKGSVSISDWSVNIYTGLTPIGSGAGHSGYLQEILPIMPILHGLLEDHSERHGCTCEKLRVIVTGHSMGGGTGLLISTLLADKYRQLGCNLRVDGVFFSAPRVLDDDLMEYYRKNVNGRVYYDMEDPITFMPCSKLNSAVGFPRCPLPGLSVPAGFGMDLFSMPPGTIWTNISYGTGTSHPAQTVRPIDRIFLGPAAAANASLQDSQATSVKSDKPTEPPEQKQQSIRSRIATYLFDANKRMHLFNNNLIDSILQAVQEYIPLVIVTRSDMVNLHLSAYACATSNACKPGGFSMLCDPVRPSDT